MTPTKPKAKKKRGIVVDVARDFGDGWWATFGGSICYGSLRRSGLPELKPGESVKVRVCIEEV